MARAGGNKRIGVVQPMKPNFHLRIHSRPSLLDN